MTSTGFDLLRVYDRPRGGGCRVLIDRLWPRGMTRAELQLDQWGKDVAPTTELRRWFGHEPARFAAFADRYRRELVEPPAALLVEQLTDAASHQRVLLLTATRDLEHSAGSVLLGVLEGRGR